MMDSTILKQDIHDFVRSFGLYERLRGTHILVTGGTGLIGSILVKCLMALNMEHDLGIRITCPVRDKEKAYSVYDDIFKHLNVYVGDLMEFIETTNESYDFILLIFCLNRNTTYIASKHFIQTIFRSPSQFL